MVLTDNEVPWLLSLGILSFQTGRRRHFTGEATTQNWRKFGFALTNWKRGMDREKAFFNTQFIDPIVFTGHAGSFCG